MITATEAGMPIPDQWMRMDSWMTTQAIPLWLRKQSARRGRAMANGEFEAHLIWVISGPWKALFITS